MAKKYKYSFTRDHEAKEGLEALVLSGISFAAFIVLAIISFAFSGNGGAVLGAAGLVAMLLAVYGCYLGLKGLAEKNTGHRFAAIGTIFAGVMSIIWLALFLVGVK